jgi:hypothetical protein
MGARAPSVLQIGKHFAVAAPALGDEPGHHRRVGKASGLEEPASQVEGVIASSAERVVQVVE